MNRSSLCTSAPFPGTNADSANQELRATRACNGRIRLVPSRMTDRPPAGRQEPPAGSGRPGALHAVTALAPASPSGDSPVGSPRSGAPAAQAPVTDRSGVWLVIATAGLAMLASAAATVSFTAQYRMVLAERHQDLAAGLEAAIPDAGALVFASLGIALALHGRRAVRARVLNVAAVAASVVMNVLAAEPGWRGLAIWAMPPVAYALASDTMIGVVRSRAVARQRALASRLADDEPTPLALAGAGLLWLLRLFLAPWSTATGFRSWVLETPVAPGRGQPPARSAGDRRRRSRSAQPSGRRGLRPGTKTARFLDLVIEHHGQLAQIEVARVSPICTQLAPLAGLDTGAARTALRKAVLGAREEGSR
jgi:hypothetical protein